MPGVRVLSPPCPCRRRGAVPLVPRRRPERAAPGMFPFLAPTHPSAWKGDSTRSACMIQHNPGPIGCETPAVACSHRRRDAGMLAQTHPISEPERALATDPGIVCAPAAAPLCWPDHFAGRIIERAAPFGDYHPASGESSSLQAHERAGRSGAGPNRSKWPREPSRVSPRDLSHYAPRVVSAAGGVIVGRSRLSHPRASASSSAFSALTPARPNPGERGEA